MRFGKDVTLEHGSGEAWRDWGERERGKVESASFHARVAKTAREDGRIESTASIGKASPGAIGPQAAGAHARA